MSITRKAFDIFKPLWNSVHMTIHPKQLFLIDAIGGLMTASLLFFLLARLEHVFGMPEKPLIVLSIIALAYVSYSFSCYCFVKHNWRPFLLIIAIANALYCVATAILIQQYSGQLTLPGFTYFIAEMAIICILVVVEIRVAQTGSF